MHKIEFFGALCECSVFEVNGAHAEVSDFGEKYDRDSDNAEPYGCGDMRFTRIEPTLEVLEKYGIDVDEYNEIASKLDALSFGGCGWCV